MSGTGSHATMWCEGDLQHFFPSSVPGDAGWGNLIGPSQKGRTATGRDVSDHLTQALDFMGEITEAEESH